MEERKRGDCEGGGLSVESSLPRRADDTWRGHFRIDRSALSNVLCQIRWEELPEVDCKAFTLRTKAEME